MVSVVEDFDVFPFIQTSDGAPSFPVSHLALCIIAAISWHYIYTQSVYTFSDKKKAARIAPLLHAVWATAASMYVRYHYDATTIFEAPSSICTTLGPTQYVFSVTLGYFLWDLFICFKENWGIDWKIHAIFCLAVYGIGTLTHTMHRWGMMTLLYEFSTIFLHSYIFSYYYGFESIGDKLKVVFALSFAYCRLVVGSFVTKECWQAYFGGDIHADCLGSSILAFVLVVNVLFHLLNLYWFSLIIRGALFGKTPAKKKKHKKSSSSSSSKRHKNGITANGK